MGTPQITWDDAAVKSPPQVKWDDEEPRDRKEDAPYGTGAGGPDIASFGRTLKEAGKDMLGSIGGMADMFSGSPVTGPLKLGTGMTGRYMDAYQGAKSAAQRGDTTESILKSIAVPFAPVGIDEIYDAAKAGNNEEAVGKGMSRTLQLLSGAPEDSALPNPSRVLARPFRPAPEIPNVYEGEMPAEIPAGRTTGGRDFTAIPSLLKREAKGLVPFGERFGLGPKPKLSEWMNAVTARKTPTELPIQSVSRNELRGPYQPYAGDLTVQGTAAGPVPSGEVPPALSPSPYRLRGNQIQDAQTVTPRRVVQPRGLLTTGTPDVAAPPAPRATRQTVSSEVPVTSTWPPDRPSAIQPREFRGRADTLEDKAIQEQMREDLEGHGRQAYSQQKRDWFARNVPGSSKGDLISQARGEVGAESPVSLRPNASGESAASQEAINRVSSEKSQGVKRFRIDTRSGKETPLFGVDAVDAKAGPYERIIKRGPNGEETIDEGPKARPVASTPRVPKSDAEREDLLMRSIRRARAAKAGD